MGGEVKTAMNIVCFPQSWDINMLGEILRGGSEKVIEAGGVLVGGHSINDVDVKYGLSVMGLVHPDKIYANNGGHPGDKLILTKKLGVGIISTAFRVGEATKEAMDQAVESMTSLNKYAAQCCKKYDIHGCTDITGFGFLGHLHEMVDGKLSCRVYADKLPVFPEALAYADEFLLTSVAQQNRNHVGRHVKFDEDISFAMQEVMFDPQSSGGLMIVLPADQADALLADIQALGVPAAIVGEMLEPMQKEIYVTTTKK
jgi:selenide,water dikinase